MLSSQFTNTVKTSVSTFSANLNNSIQLVNIYTIKGSNVAECHVFDIVDVWKLLYILNISVKSNNIEKAYITATLTAEGDDEFIFKLNNSYNMSLPSNAGSCMTCSACGNYTNFYKNSTKTFDITQYLQDTNSIYVYFHNFTGGYSYKISNLEFTIKTYSKLQFTDTIKVLCNNASKQILISKPFTAPTSTSERCRQYGYYYGIPIEDFVGSSGAASQTKTFTASDFLYSEHIKKYEVKFACGNGTCVFRINGEIKYNKTMCATCPDRSSGITVSMPVTISSSSSLNSGFAQSAFRVCAFYQFTDTINTVNPDCNVKAETKYQSVNITLPFNLVISPQDRWCEIHLSRVDYITTVSGGFPNTAVRVDFTSSSGHDPNYSNRIMYFDANGNLTFSNFCTQQSHSGSVDTWNITYMGKHYHFTIHWYW